METQDPVYVASKVINAQARLLVAYRVGETSPPQWVFDDLAKYKPIWEAISNDGGQRI